MRYRTIICLCALLLLGSMPFLFSACGNNSASPTSSKTNSADTATFTPTPTPATSTNTTTVTNTATRLPGNPYTTNTYTATNTMTMTVTGTPVLTATPYPTTAWTLYATLGQSGSDGINGDFEEPVGIALGAGYIAVGDQGYGNVQVFNSSGTYLYSIPAHASGSSLTGLCIDSRGELYVSDFKNAEVDGFYLGPTSATYDYTWTGQGSLSGPNGVTIDPSGNLVVGDWEEGILYNLAWADDSVLNQSTWNTANFAPIAVILDAQENIYAADSYSEEQVDQFDSNYSYINSFAGTGWTTALGGPIGLGMDSQGNLFIVDNSNDRVVYSTTQGSYLGELDGFNNPQYLALDNADDLFVVNQGTHNVKEYTR